MFKKEQLSPEYYSNLFKIVNEYKVKIEANRGEVKKYLDEKQLLKLELDKKDNLLVENEETLEKLIKNCPGNQNDLFDMQKKNTLNLKGKLDIFKKNKLRIIKK